MRNPLKRITPGRSPAALAAFFLGLACPGITAAQVAEPGQLAFNISPLRIEMGSSETNTLFRVENVSGSELAIQARSFSWTQVDGKDQYNPSIDYTVTPSITRIAPGKTQTFRIIKRGAAREGESAYRVVLDQLPSSAPMQNIGAATRLRITVPMFVGRDRALPASLSWSVNGGSIAVANGGGRTVKLQQVKIAAGSVMYVVGNGAQHYILPQSHANWPVPAGLACIPKGAELIGTLDGKAFREPAPVTCR